MNHTKTTFASLGGGANEAPPPETPSLWTYRAPAVVWALLLFALSSIPNLPSPFHVFSFDDKIEHVGAYAILGALAVRAVAMRRHVPNWPDVGLAFIMCTMYGMLDEFHQFFVPGRSVDYLDFAADTVGSILGAVVYLAMCRRWRLHRLLG